MLLLKYTMFWFLLKGKKGSIMSRIICLPGSYVQGNGEMGRLSDYVGAFGASGACLIVDRFINNTYHDLIVESFEEKKILYSVNEFGGECCMK